MSDSRGWMASGRGRRPAGIVMVGALMAGLLGALAPAASATGPNAAPKFAAATAAPYTAVPATRICDTRIGQPGVPGNQCDGNGATAGTLGAGGTLAVSVAGQFGVPATATAAVLNVTVTGTSASSFLTVWPTGLGRPSTSNLNWTPGQTVPNLVEVPIGAGGQVSVFNNAGSADVFIDLEGFVDTSSTGLYNALTPARICDSRAPGPNIAANQCNHNGASAGTLSAGSSIAVTVAGLGGVPLTGVSAVVLNVTVTGTTASSYLSAWPGATIRPLASNLNWSSGQTVANRVIVPVGADGTVGLYNDLGSADVLVDVGGFFRTTGGASYTPMPAVRLCDTRGVQPNVAANQCNHNGTAPGTLGAGGALQLTVSGQAGIPATGVAAVVLNVTVTNTTASSYLTAWPDGPFRPNVSDLNWAPGQTVANLVVVAVGTDGKVDLYNNLGNADMAVDVEGYYTSPNTLTWRPPTQVDFGGYSPTAVSCPTATVCVAVDQGADPASGHVSSANAITYDGSTWSVAAIDPGGVLLAVSCPSTTFCMAVGGTAFGGGTGGHFLTFNGTTWSAPSVIDTNGLLVSVSCVSSTFCAAVDLSGHALTLTGTKWSAPVALDAGNTLHGVSCVTTTFCVAVGGTANGQTGFTYFYNGTRWTGPKIISHLAPQSVSCVTTTFCMAVGGGFALKYNGVAWSAPVAVGTGETLDAVSCPTTTFCVAAGGTAGASPHGDAAKFDGATWSTPVAVDASNLAAVSCPTTTFCAAVSQSGDAATFNGTAWTPPRPIDYGLTSVSCPTTTFCAAVDGAGHVVTYNGTTWSVPKQIDPTVYLTSVSCPTSTFCAAVGGSGHALTFNGTIWSAPTVITNQFLLSVSCPTTTFCAAVDFGGHAVTYNGTVWAAPVVIDAANPSLFSVSCPTAAFCAAVDTGGHALTFNGTTWSAPVAVDTTNGLSSVSCSTATFCAAFGPGGAFTFDGTNWSGADPVDQYVSAVSCPTNTFCAAVDRLGRVITFNGTVWSTPVTINAPQTPLSAVSCPTASFCVAVDPFGDAVIGSR